MKERRGSAKGLLQVVSLHFVGWYNIKGLEISLWTYPILGEPCYISVSLVMCFNNCIIFILYCYLSLILFF